MSEQFLHGADVVAVFQQVSGKRMSQRVATHVLGNAGRMIVIGPILVPRARAPPASPPSCTA